MTSIIAFRLSATCRRRLEEFAKLQGTTLSGLIRSQLGHIWGDYDATIESIEMDEGRMIWVEGSTDEAGRSRKISGQAV